MCEIGPSELMTVTHLNKQIPALLLWQSSSTLPAGLEARVFVPQFSDLALLSVTVLRPRLLRLTLASLARHLREQLPKLCVRGCAHGRVWSSLRGYRACAFSLVTWPVPVLGDLDEAPSLVEQGLRKREEMAVLEGHKGWKWNRMMRPSA